MKKEIQSAVGFVKTLLKGKTSLEKADYFAECFENVLCSHYEDHWFPKTPCKGSGYRCMRIVNREMDPLMAQAGALSGYTQSDMLSLLPAEFTLWIDPDEVSYRIGEEGSIGVLYSRESDNSQSSSDCDSDTSGSLSSSPGPQDYTYSSFPQHHDSQLYQQQYHSYSPFYGQVQAAASTNWSDYLSTFVAS